MSARRVLLAAVLCLAMPCLAGANSNFSSDLAALDAVLEPTTPDAVDRALQQHQGALQAPDFVRALYAQRDLRPVWTEATYIMSLQAGLHAGLKDGLSAGELRRASAEDPFNPAALLSAAERDILLTDTLVALGDRLVNGRADPRGLAPSDDVPLAWQDPEPQVLAELSTLLDAGDIPAVVADMRPDSALYLRLREAMARLLETGESTADINALRINLERARWFDRLLGDQDRVVVNIPAYTVTLHLEGEDVWQTRAIVGKPENRTPVFVSTMKNIVLDPTWTVPRSIIEERMFDEARTDPADFSARGFRLRDARGAWHDPKELHWSRYSADAFPYDIVQMPGAQNALGRMKFMFDNPYSVYLHDTSAPGLFESDARAFSHGCVRVDQPDELARLILGDRGGLDAQAIASLHADGENLPVDLFDPLTIGLLYWTVDVSDDGELVFHNDIYDRDGVILQALDDFSSPPLLQRTRGS